ncbi:GNAT family N-acetyltransferase [Paenibacillus tarimensis]
MEVHYKNFIISDDKTKIQIDVVLEYLARSYWANKRPPERTMKSIENSICYGVYDGKQQVAYARVITDGATMFYLCDVFVLEDYQGKGIGKKLVEIIVNSDEFIMMTGLLGTLDAHGLYEQFGFEREPDKFMKRLPQRWGNVNSS